MSYFISIPVAALRHGRCRGRSLIPAAWSLAEQSRPRLCPFARLRDRERYSATLRSRSEPLKIGETGRFEART
jgi:hypothetical protein